LKKSLFIFFVLLSELGVAQWLKKDTLPYNRKEEIVYDGKRYRKYNNYLTIGGGYLWSSVRNMEQKILAGDFQFHFQKQYFQFGFLMSGKEFLSNNNIQGHIGIGYRREKEQSNLAFFVGPSYSTFVTAKLDSTGEYTPVVNSGMGGYICAQYIYKVKYDVGIGLELFGDFSANQQMGGLKIIAFFSGAYRGVKRGWKTKPPPTVKPQSP
jgi:hypothetical protein